MPQAVAIADSLKRPPRARGIAYAELARLDRIGFIELLPNNRIRLLVARTFAWIPNGPLERVEAG